MNIEYNVVPNIISCKDLDYLSDMFNWNYGAHKSSYNAISSTQDNELKNMLESVSNTFYDNMTRVLNILNNGGSNE